MLSHDYDEGVRSDADTLRDDEAAGRLAVPGPRAPSAVQLLEMTARETDQWRADAQAEAEAIVATARDEARALLSQAQGEAESLVDAARLEAGRTVDEARATAAEVRADTEQRRAHEEAEVARLQQISTDHDQRLRQHLTEVLDRLDGAPTSSGLRRRDDA